MQPFQLEIPKRRSECAKNGETLLPGTDYYSILIENEEFGYLRQDFCLPCWEILIKEKQSPLAYTSWKSQVPVKKERQEEPSLKRHEKFIALLKEIAIKQSPEAKAESYLLALYLARKKLLFLRHELKQNEETLLLFEIAATEEMITIPKVSLIQAEKIQDQLAHQLRCLDDSSTP